jgi:hypothetical protein
MRFATIETNRSATREEKRMSTDVNIAKQIVHDKLESQLKTAKAKLDVLAGRAEGKAVKVEVKAFETLMVKLRAI